jgi:hypothetical protein
MNARTSCHDSPVVYTFNDETQHLDIIIALHIHPLYNVLPVGSKKGRAFSTVGQINICQPQDIFLTLLLCRPSLVQADELRGFEHLVNQSAKIDDRTTVQNTELILLCTNTLHSFKAILINQNAECTVNFTCNSPATR